VIEHPVKFKEAEHSERTNQQPKQDFEPGECDEERDRPEHDRTDESQNEDRAARNRIRPGLLKGHGHAFASSPRNESGASEDEPPIRAGLSGALVTFDFAHGFA
jgi:hypothetical protein